MYHRVPARHHLTPAVEKQERGPIPPGRSLVSGSCPGWTVLLRWTQLEAPEEAEVREDWEQGDTHEICSCPVFRAVHFPVCSENCLVYRLV